VGLKDIASEINADQHNRVRHSTWGHLFPADDWTAEGIIVVADTTYDGTVIIAEDEHFPQSPWWHASIYDWADGFVTDRAKENTVWKAIIKAYVKQLLINERKIFIKTIKYAEIYSHKT